MKPILETKSMYKAYDSDKQRYILNNIDLRIEKGEFVAVMGPSGSGKSTLLYCLSGLDKVTSGRVILDGKEVNHLSEKELSRIRLHKMGFIFQHIHLLKNLSLFDNIIFSAYLAKKSSRAQINKKARELMEQLGVGELAHHDVTEASGGQLQRVAVCRALINNPIILFGDEPTGALDSRAARDMMELLVAINETGTTILIVTHDLKVAAKAQRILYMVDGNMRGEKRLGIYEPEEHDSKIREEILSKWLLSMTI